MRAEISTSVSFNFHFSPFGLHDHSNQPSMNKQTIKSNETKVGSNNISDSAILSNIFNNPLEN
jgi:hypothetical protein